MRNIIFMGTKPLGCKCLEMLINNSKCCVKGVLTRSPEEKVWWDENYRVYKYAERLNIPIISETDMANMDIDFIFSVQYHKILSREILQLPKYGGINLHMAPLPEYRGSNQFSFAIINNEREFGTTLHYMSTKIDGGDIISQRRFPIKENITVTQLYQKTEEESVLLFKESLNSILNLQNQRTKQSQIAIDKIKYFYSRNDINAHKCIDLKWSDEKIYRYIRALDFPPFESPFSMVKGKKIYLTLYKGRRR